MGYYFGKAKTKEVLSDEQQARYQALRSTDSGDLHPELLRRLGEVKEYIGSIYNGEDWSAYEELVQDAVVTWILAGEHLSNVQWSAPRDLVVPEPELTEEELAARKERWENTLREIKEAHERRERDLDEAFKKNYPIHYLIWKLLKRFNKIP